jgi:hypothetical protein
MSLLAPESFAPGEVTDGKRTCAVIRDVLLTVPVLPGDLDVMLLLSNM